MSAVNKDGNKVFNAISDEAHIQTQALSDMISGLDDLYWANHHELAEIGYSDKRMQRDAMDRLGRLAQALKALDAARYAMNNCRCW